MDNINKETFQQNTISHSEDLYQHESSLMFCAFMWQISLLYLRFDFYKF